MPTDTATATINTSFQKTIPAWPSLRSRRTKWTIAAQGQRVDEDGGEGRRRAGGQGQKNIDAIVREGAIMSS